ncbi:MAG: ABC transporter substrate-binding protein [Hyphomicrobiaceae bacterium]|nr:ABC transporter substrate-binding protein [Hyphomicrobiaceae bacterium]
MLNKRRALSGALGLALAALIAGGPAAAQKAGGTLVQITQPEPPNLAPYISTSGPIGQVTAKVFDGLLEYDFDLKPQPSLAESFEVSADGKTITFKLRKNAKFHDGKPFTSADVQFTVMEVLKKNHPRGLSTFAEVTTVETPDPHTAIFKLQRPAPYLMTALSGYESPMLPKHIYGEGDIKTHPNANKPVGTGPFKFVEWRRGEFVRLDKNKDYWREGMPYLDRIVVRFIADSSTRTAALEKGEAHVAGFGAVPYNDVKKLAALPHLDVTTKGYEMISPIVELVLNTKLPPLDNQKVRQAISYAVDRKFMIDNVWFGFGKPAMAPISSNFAPTGYYIPGVDYTVADRIERANRLLDEAGFPKKADGFRFELIHDITPYGEEWQRAGEAVQQALAQVGIKATLRYEDVAKWLKRVYTDYDFAISSNFLYNLADPVLGVHRGFHSRLIRPGTVFVNGSRWSSPETDAFMDQATIETDQAKRGALYKNLIAKVTEASPVIYVLELTFPTIINTQFKNVITTPLGIYGNYATAYKE